MPNLQFRYYIPGDLASEFTDEVLNTMDAEIQGLLDKEGLGGCTHEELRAKNVTITCGSVEKMLKRIKTQLGHDKRAGDQKCA